jgi:tetratricopeptide (TPR) repeat protein
MPKQDQKEADFLAKEGKSLYRAKKYLPAADSFQQAAAEYAAGGNALLSAEMRNNQCVSLLLAKQPRSAIDAVQGTSEIFQEAGQIVKAGMALANEATALKDIGESDSALETFTRAGDLFRSAGEEELYLQTMQSISSLKFQSRDLTGALFSMRRGLEGVEKPNWRQKLLKNLLSIPDKFLNQ